MLSESLAQRLPPIFSQPYKPGVYRTFQEFVHNEPSITQNFTVVTESGDRKIEKGKGDYQIVFSAPTFNKSDLKNIWGASDGTSVFVNERMYGGVVNLKKIHGIGRYCYFKGYSPANTMQSAMATGGILGGAAVAIADPEETYILNINNGKFFILTKSILIAILKKDTALLAEYEEESRKGNAQVLVDYIQKYNARHVNEADLDAITPLRVVIYRRAKKEQEKVLTIKATDSTIFDLAPNDFRKLEVFTDSIDLCIREKCKTIQLQKSRLNYIHAFWKVNTLEPELKLVDQKEGEFYFKEVQYYNAKK